MKLFQQKTVINKCETAKEFAEAYQIGKGDFILASKSTYDAYFTPLGLDAHVEYKSEYGKGEPTDVMIDALIADYKASGCDRIIAIGGGGVIDMAKILVLEGEHTAEQVYRRQVPLKKAHTLIAVPTTCGAGSEVSNVSIAELTSIHSKMGLADDSIFADEAVLVPELLTKLPYSFFATSAIDAFIHAIESYVSPKATLYTRMFSNQAMEMILDGFQKIVEYGPEYRMEILDQFLVASDLAGVAFGNAGTGAVHAMSYPLSGEYHVAHGEANYLFLTAVFAEYQRVNPDGELKELNEHLAGLLHCEVDQVYVEIEKLLDKIIARKKLHEYGMTEDQIQSFAEGVEQNQQRLLNQSYVKFNVEQMVKIYRQLF
ncbi:MULTISPECIES: 4-hydroxybutyrate dehydrogenase [unclassified Dorea]|jgi:4-hydroxybutyrate dehydrogenase|uniref:4-hydroxybutyrate dehydrogenase n=1 Tax=unclassified Dorea TaxID=2627917 RepID=UPI000E468DA3|nr:MULTISPECIES: 4-hydroxybutyrate dehydrogenase [unclassified Dorea]MEE0072039.1 4-hydroxybutyrate dehydrogenase [Lachnospiraceae bacterium]RGY80614.1 iron-containing alcohol dehydrogenase [Dorea sp. AM58-8]RHP06680.1 iron-containing alcohol dehydrogenase [Dorea sp. AF36-15AT]